MRGAGTESGDSLAAIPKVSGGAGASPGSAGAGVAAGAPAEAGRVTPGGGSASRLSVPALEKNSTRTRPVHSQRRSSPSRCVQRRRNPWRASSSST